VAAPATRKGDVIAVICRKKKRDPIVERLGGLTKGKKPEESPENGAGNGVIKTE